MRTDKEDTALSEKDSEITNCLKAMVGELDLTYQVEASRTLGNLLKVQRAQRRIERKADAAIAKVRKIDVVTANHLKEGDSQCSFCRKWQSEVELLIAGPDGVFICNECVDNCVDCMKDFRAQK